MQLKQDLVTFPVLKLYNPQLITELHTDASNLAVTGILLQNKTQKLGPLLPITVKHLMMRIKIS